MALTFGLVVLAMIYTIGDVSGCQLILAQFAGAFLASLALRAMFLLHPTLGAALPADTAVQSWVMEFILTLMLIVILSVSTGSQEKGVLAGVAVGSVIALEAMFAGSVSGASMNPARWTRRAARHPAGC